MKIYSLQENEQILTQLFSDYALYSELVEQLSEDMPPVQRNVLQLKMQQISDRMKYPNPYIWIAYKIEAYKDLPSRIHTIGDLKQHCHDATHICHQRFHFLQNILKNAYHIDVLGEDVHERNVFDVIPPQILQEISQNQSYMQQRWKYEYYSEDGKVMKWKNYLLIDE